MKKFKNISINKKFDLNKLKKYFFKKEKEKIYFSFQKEFDWKIFPNSKIFGDTIFWLSLYNSFFLNTIKSYKIKLLKNFLKYSWKTINKKLIDLIENRFKEDIENFNKYFYDFDYITTDFFNNIFSFEWNLDIKWKKEYVLKLKYWKKNIRWNVITFRNFEDFWWKK